MATTKIAARQQTHDIRFAIAMPPNTMIKMMATGVSHARILVCSEVAPVRNGDAACPRASCGSSRTMLNAIAGSVALPCFPRAQSMLHPQFELFRGTIGTRARALQRIRFAENSAKLTPVALVWNLSLFTRAL